MDIFKIIGIALTGGILTMTVRRLSSEYAVITGLASVIVLLLGMLDTLSIILEQISDITEKSGVDIKYITAIIKVVGIAYVTQIGAQILRDGGEGAIALKLELAGKIFILGITLPIVTEFLEVCINALSAV